MTKRSKIISKIRQKLFGVDFREIQDTQEKIKVTLGQLNIIEDKIISTTTSIETALNKMKNDILLIKKTTLASRDTTSRDRTLLNEFRQSDDYKDIFAKKEPLVTVRIATYNRTQDLIEKSLKSVLSQTYTNLEIIIVNDGPNNKTKKAVEDIGDKRIRFIELPSRGFYPDNAHDRWYVAGSPAMNYGSTMATGDWIAPLDDDDEFTPDHIEKLLKGAKNTKSELFYGSLIKKNVVTGEEEAIWSDKPERGMFSFQGSIYAKGLNFLEYDTKSWVIDEPGDWNLARRMLEAGVSYASTQDVVGIMYHTPITNRTEG